MQSKVKNGHACALTLYGSNGYIIEFGTFYERNDIDKIYNCINHSNERLKYIKWNDLIKKLKE